MENSPKIGSTACIGIGIGIGIDRGGGTYSSILLKCGDTFDPQVFLGVVLYIKNKNIFEKHLNWIFTPEPGVWKIGLPHYMAKQMEIILEGGMIA